MEKTTPMHLKAFTKHDTNTMTTQCGKQPSWVRIDSGGTMAYTTQIGDAITSTVLDGEWFPCDDIKLIKATGTSAVITVAAINP
jgi:hypothetical protein